MSLFADIEKAQNDRETQLMSPGSPRIPDDLTVCNYNGYNEGSKVTSEVTHRSPAETCSLYDQNIQDAIKKLNAAGCTVMKLSPKLRKETLDLEEKMTKALNEGREKDFRSMLEQWENLFLSSCTNE